ncbi:DUF4189 domain-containing protein [Nocardia sp. NPDC004860]|uniref:DUF4189 domain-containing protein n=1 Tax=Nocardia sp. NPDC004860 TaxID=3154557 RepID=UPI0033A5CD7F
MKRLVLAAAALLTLVTASATTEPAAHALPPRWGAVAYSDSTGWFGIAWDSPTLADAVAAAKDKCRYSDCRYVFSWKNGCMAIAKGSGGIAFGSAFSQPVADRMARTKAGPDAYVIKQACTRSTY